MKDSNIQIKSTTLDLLPNGANTRVLAVSDKSTVSRRLMEMGVIPGVAVRVVKSAPFGCPMEIRVRGYNLALRRSEANAILVTNE